MPNKESIIELYESNVSSTSVLSRKRCRESDFSEVNEALYSWYLFATSRNIYPGGPQLCEKAKQIADQLNISHFKASNGWLARWKTRHNVKQLRVCGESGEVRGETVESWKERLPELLQGYSSNNIYNLDETGCFWRALPESGFGIKGVQCHGGKKSKHRFTVVLIVNADGEKEVPIIIWKSEKPRCFKGINVSTLPVHYYSQSKAWMNGEILDKVLTKLNRKFSSQHRNVALLLDNAGCHPEELKGKYSNIKLIFLPPNTTSKLQPLDVGIIQNFKVHYRTLLLRYVLSKIDQTTYTAADISKSVNVLKAIRWVAEGWGSVKRETIVKCFKKCGIISGESAVVARIGANEDPFDDVDEARELTALVDELGLHDSTCSPQEYVTGDDNLPVCDDAGDDWDEHFLAGLSRDQADTEEPEDQEDDSYDLEPPSPKIKTYKEAVSAIEDIQAFLDFKGHNELSTKLGTHINSIVSLQCAHTCKTSVQTTIDDFF